MCSVSMIMDHYHDKWIDYMRQPLTITTAPFVQPPRQTTPMRIPSDEEIAEFHALLKRARDYDQKHNQPDCELEEKKQALLKVAEQLGIKITIDEPAGRA